MAAASSVPASPVPADQLLMPEPSKDDERRWARIRQAWAAYRGEFKDPLDVLPGQYNDNVAPNFCAQIVDTGVDWLFGKPVKIEVKPKKAGKTPTATPDNQPDSTQGAPTNQDALDTEEQPAADPVTQRKQEWLDACLGSPDKFHTLLSEGAMNGAMSGHAFFKIVWDEEKMQYPRVQVLDSGNVFVTTDPDDVNLPIAYTVQYKTTLTAIAPLTGSSHGAQQAVLKRIVYLRHDPDGNARVSGGEDANDFWTITAYQALSNVTGSAANSNQATPGKWQMVGQPILWPHPWCPIHANMNLLNPNEYWGLPDLPENLIHLNEALIFLHSNVNRLIKHYSAPSGFLIGAGRDGEVVQVSPGEFRTLPEHATVSINNAHGDVAGILAYIKVLLSDMDEQSRVPGVALGREETLPKGNISGVALKLLEAPLMAKTTMKQRLYGPTIDDLCLHLLELGGLGNADDTEMEVHWQNLLPVDDFAAAQTAQVLTSIGLSEPQALEDLGYDYDDQLEKQARADAKKVALFARGQGMPPGAPPPGAAPPPQAGPGPAGSGGPIPPGAPGAQQGQSGQPQPPTNHPAAVAMRNAMKQAGGKR